MSDSRPQATGDEVRIRPATPDDLPRVRTQLQHAALPLDGLEEHFGAGFVVAVAGGELIGVAGVEVHGRHGLLRSVAVTAERRGSGLGRRLVRDRIAWARGRGLTSLSLLTTTAAAWFDRLGFATTTRAALPPALRASREFSEACPETAAAMTMQLER
ncbi:MAG: GNAT family N-acetyltransferase [Candidatus Latescibacterota bacterium]|nr:MAG: GNAT family N-acetyltransferase [Candidatus Latescibacterota bacterium]